jgi:macrolide transport system ATP-binding/permease protein
LTCQGGPICRFSGTSQPSGAVDRLKTVLQDFRFELRQLRRAPAFALTAVFTLALGVCASVTIFAFVDDALIKPLRYPDASRLVGVYERVEVFPRSNLSYLDSPRSCCSPR